jgi:hypothetical protein
MGSEESRDAHDLFLILGAGSTKVLATSNAA